MTLDQKALEAELRNAAKPRKHYVGAGRWATDPPPDADLMLRAADALAARSAIVEEPMLGATPRERTIRYCAEIAWDAAFAWTINHKGTEQAASDLADAVREHVIVAAASPPSPQPHTGRATVAKNVIVPSGVTGALVETLRWYAEAAWTHEGDATVGLLGDGGKRARAALNAALTVQPVAPTKDEIRNEIARREEAGVDARVPLTGPAKFKDWSDADLRSAVEPEAGEVK